MQARLVRQGNRATKDCQDHLDLRDIADHQVSQDTTELPEPLVILDHPDHREDLLTGNLLLALQDHLVHLVSVEN